MRIIKRLLIVFGIVFVLLLIGGLIAFRQLRSRPAFFRPYTWTMEERSILSQRAFNKFVPVQNDASRLTTSAAVRTGQQGQPHRISFSEEEINAFLLHNAETIRQSYDQHITNPGIYLEKDQIIFAAEAKAYGYVISLILEPKIDETGQLSLRLTRALGGNLPLPRGVLDGQIEKLAGHIRSQLPSQIQRSAITTGGRANTAAIQAMMGKLILAALEDRTADAVVPVPIASGGEFVLYRLTALQLTDDELAATLEPMTLDSRKSVVSSLRDPAAAAK